MEREQLISEFLKSRRARVDPGSQGLPQGDRRRVPGLRREEVAMLAGVSVDYYVQIERGKANNVSDEILDALARALVLDPAERAHLYTLVRGVPFAERPTSTDFVRVPKTTSAILAAMDAVPAIVLNARFDLLDANSLGRSLYAQAWEPPGSANLARYTFLDRRAQAVLLPWEDSAETVAAMLLKATGTDPDDAALQHLVEELLAGSPEFRALWNRQNLETHYRGSKRLHLPGEEPLDVMFEVLALPDLSGISIIAYTGVDPAATRRLLTQLGVRRSPGLP